MLHYSLHMKSNKATCSLLQFLEQAITPINSASLTVKRCYSAFTHLCTSAIVLKGEQMVIIISINNYFPKCSSEVQLNKYSHKLASHSYS